MLIAESGASKTAWRWCQAGQMVRAWESPGLNPNTLDEAELLRRLRAALEQPDLPLPAGQVFFYGAGLGPLSQRAKITRLLRQVLSPTSEIAVHHDLMAAVRATGWSEGIVAILGTGSNACRFHGEEGLERQGGLGYLLGDEGSGTDLGRSWLKALLENTLPATVIEQSQQVMGRSASTLLREVYQAERPAAFMAGLAPLLHQLLHEPTLRTLVRDRFLIFLDGTICQLEGHQHLPLALFGSIAFHFQAVWLEACLQRHLRVPQVEAAPIDGLVRYHLGRLSDENRR